MAKLFANKFDLDQLPDPKKPKQDIQQGSTTVQKVLDKEFITNPNIQVNKIESGDRITNPKLDIKPIKQGDRTVNPDTNIKIVNQGSMITDPQLEIDPVVSGDRITNPNIRVEPVEPIDINTQRLNARFRDIDSQKNAMSTSDEILESQGVSKSSAEQYVSKTKTEPFGEKPVEQGSTNIKPPANIEDKISPVDIKRIDQGSMITDPKVEISKIDQGSKIINPNTEVQKIQPGDRIVDPNTIIKPIAVGDRITDPKTVITPVAVGERTTNPNTVINPVAVGDRTTNPNTVIPKVEPGDRITDPKTTVIPAKTDEFTVNPNTVINKVKDGDRIVDPNTVIKKVNADEKIVNPNIQPQESKEIDPSKSIPNNTKGVGVTKLFPKTISLKNRLEQANLGTTRHLPEYILSDQNTGVLTIKNPKVIEKTSNITIQKIQYENFVLNQGGVEDMFKGITSFINPVKYGDREVNQGSIEIKNNQKFVEKTSPVEIKKVAVGERTIDPKTKITKVQPGERTIDPNTKIQTITPGERTTDPKTEVKLVEPGERTVDPKLEIKPIVAGERTVDPKLVIPLVESGDRTVDPKTIVRPVEPGERTTIVENRLYLFPQVDNKVFFTQEPAIFVNVFDIFPSDGMIPFTGDIIVPPPIYDSLAIFPGTQIPQFVDTIGVAYVNSYGIGSKYSVDNTTSPLKIAGEKETPMLERQYNVGSSTVVENREVVFPPAQYGDPNLPGGYRLLNYGEIQRRRTDNPNRGLDFSYEDRSGGLQPINQRLGMPDKGADTINTSYDATANDLVMVKLRSRRDDLTLQFRSYIKSFSDNYTANYTDVNYVGRPDTLKVFKGTVRQISLAFTLPVMSADELKVVYQKLNALVRTATMGKKGAAYMQGPFLLLTVGGWCKETPIIVNSLKYDTQPLEYTWDIIHEVPQIIDISLDCIALADNTGEGTYSDGTFIQYGAL